MIPAEVLHSISFCDGPSVAHSAPSLRSSEGRNSEIDCQVIIKDNSAHL